MQYVSQQSAISETASLLPQLYLFSINGVWASKKDSFFSVNGEHVDDEDILKKIKFFYSCTVVLLHCYALLFH